MKIFQGKSTICRSMGWNRELLDYTSHYHLIITCKSYDRKSVKDEATTFRIFKHLTF